MADFLLVAEKRRSCRSFTAQPVDFDIILDMIKAGSYAPSAADIQPWEFIVVTDKNKIVAVAGLCPRQEWMSDAPLLIVVVGDEKKLESYFGEEKASWCTMSCSAAIQNMLLAAADRGAGACWVTSFDPADLRDFFGVPDGKTVEAVIALGMPGETPGDKKIVPLDQLTHFNVYGQHNQDVSFVRKDFADAFREEKDVTREKKGLMDFFKKKK